MNNISVVIISFNAEKTIEKVLDQALLLSDDIVVIDSLSTDKTKEICLTKNIHYKEQNWLGFGPQKNLGNQQAKNNWILSIDADEVLSNELINELKSLSLDTNTVYNIPFKNIYCGQEIKYGRWKNEHHIRLFNKAKVNWDDKEVHESLVLNNASVKKLKNDIYHYSMNSKVEHLAKAKKYALLGAEKLHKEGKKATFIKLYINPVFRFIKDYFFSLGFLDGKLGFQIAVIIAKETYWKYAALRDL